MHIMQLQIVQCVWQCFVVLRLRLSPLLVTDRWT